jgi:hypothetical protein
MKYLKTYETFRLKPLSDDDINEVFNNIREKLLLLGLSIESKIQPFGRLQIEDQKYRVIFEIDSDLSKIENSILYILISKIVKEPFNYAGIPYGTNIEVILLNEFPGEHADKLLSDNSFYINPQTPEELFKEIINKLIETYETRTDKLSVLTSRLIKSATNNMYSNVIIKQVILDYLTAISSNKETPEYIYKEVSDAIQNIENPYKTAYFLKNNEPFTTIYNNVVKYLPEDIKKASNMGEMGFGD